MKRSIEDHASRFDEYAPAYDDRQDDPEYRAARDLVIEHADPAPSDTVLDLGCGTGAIALALAPKADRVLGRDISEGMLEEFQEKASGKEIENVDITTGSFREPNVSADIDIVGSNFAMHHLGDDEKRTAIEVIADMAPRRFVLGDPMLFTGEPADPLYDPAVDDPATVGTLANAITDAGFALTAVERIHEQIGVLVAEPL